MTRPTFPCDFAHVLKRADATLVHDAEATPARSDAEANGTDSSITSEWLAAQEFEPWDPDQPCVPTDVEWQTEGFFHLSALRMAEGVCLKTKPELVESLGRFDNEEQIRATFDFIRQTREACERFVQLCHAGEVRLLVGMGVLAVQRGGGR